MNIHNFFILLKVAKVAILFCLIEIDIFWEIIWHNVTLES